MGHIYDAFINSALDASLAQDILAAVGGNVETLLVRTFRGLSFPGEAPDWGMPEGTSLVGSLFGPFMRAVSKQWMVTRLSDDRVVVKELGLERFRNWPVDPLHLGPEHKVMMQYFRRVWPDKEEVSQVWFENWESWGLEEG